MCVYAPGTILADIYEYDELITGERREGEFGVYIDFFGEKVSLPASLSLSLSLSFLKGALLLHQLPSIPGEVIPLMLMSSMGYVANTHPQNESVVPPPYSIYGIFARRVYMLISMCAQYY